MTDHIKESNTGRNKAYKAKMWTNSRETSFKHISLFGLDPRPFIICIASQAAFLDLGTAGAVAQALAAVIPRIAASSGPPQAEAVAVTTMLMEVVTVLLSPDLCLNPAAPPEQRAIDECPSVAEVRFQCLSLVR